jgi:hypothetical protein
VAFKKKPEPATPRWSPRQVARMPLALVVRTVLLALVAIGGAAWGLVRHYSHVNPPMLVPVSPRGGAAPAPTYDADAGEFPVPDLEAPSRP